MKLWKWLIPVAVVALVGFWVYRHPRLWNFSSASSEPSEIEWRMVNQPADGFQVEMPATPRSTHASAQSDSGGAESVNMLIANPDSQSSFSVSWADNPPVFRASGGSVTNTLKLARDQFLARTQTIAVSESQASQNGLQAYDVMAQNAGGGVLQARLFLSGSRLYMLSAAYPSVETRQEQDVLRFFNSFKTTTPAPLDLSRSAPRQ